MKSLQDQHDYAFHAYATYSSLISLLWFYGQHDHGHGRDRGHGHNHDRYDRCPLHHYDHGCDARVGPRQPPLPTSTLPHEDSRGRDALHRLHVHDRDRIYYHGHYACYHACEATFYFHAHVSSHARFSCARDDAPLNDDAHGLYHRDFGHANHGNVYDHGHGAHGCGCNFDDHGVLPLAGWWRWRGSRIHLGRRRPSQ